MRTRGGGYYILYYYYTVLLVLYDYYYYCYYYYYYYYLPCCLAVLKMSWTLSDIIITFLSQLSRRYKTRKWFVLAAHYKSSSALPCSWFPAIQYKKFHFLMWRKIVFFLFEAKIMVLLFTIFFFIFCSWNRFNGVQRVSTKLSVGKTPGSERATL